MLLHNRTNQNRLLLSTVSPFILNGGNDTLVRRVLRGLNTQFGNHPHRVPTTLSQGNAIMRTLLDNACTNKDVSRIVTHSCLRNAPTTSLQPKTMASKEC